MSTLSFPVCVCVCMNCMCISFIQSEVACNARNARARILQIEFSYILIIVLNFDSMFFTIAEWKF